MQPEVEVREADFGIDEEYARLRGEPGSTVELEVKYPCGGERTVEITRDVVRMSY